MSFDKITKINRFLLIGIFFVILVGIAIIFIKNNKLDANETIRSEKFHYYLYEKVSSLGPIEGKHKVINNFDIQINQRMAQIQNQFFESVISYEGLIDFRFYIPSNIADEDVFEFCMYQALNSALVLNKIDPSTHYKLLKITAFRKGIPNERSYVFDFDKLKRISKYSKSEIQETVIN